MAALFTQAEKAAQLYTLHHSGDTLVLPNIWDPLGALLLEAAGYKAVATASAAVAYSNGYDDGEHIPLPEFLGILTKITAAVNVPVTADIESGYASDDAQLEKSIRLFIETGIVGINIEDTEKQTGKQYAVETQCRRIRIIRKVAHDMGVPLFINARTDVYLPNSVFTTPESRFEEAVKRGLAYLQAGANGFFPIAIREFNDLKNMVAQVPLPLNVLTIPGIPDIKTLKEIGVARLSLGPSFLKIAVQAMGELAMKLSAGEGLEDIFANEITTPFLKKLVERGA